MDSLFLSGSQLFWILPQEVSPRLLKIFKDFFVVVAKALVQVVHCQTRGVDQKITHVVTKYISEVKFFVKREK
jgi:hypothetical protein